MDKLKQEILSPAAPILEVLEDLTKTAAKIGYEIRSVSAASLNRFHALPSNEQDRLIESLSICCQSFASASSTSNLQTVDAQALRWALSRLRLSVPEDFYSAIRPGDVVEVYEFSEFRQIWRNLEFLRLCSYDVITLSTTPLPELFARDEAINQLIFNEAMAAKTEHRTSPFNVPEHELVERLDKHNLVFRIGTKFRTPVFNQGNEVVGFVSTLRAELVGSAYRHSENVVPIPV